MIKIINKFNSNDYQFTKDSGDYLTVKYNELKKNDFTFDYKSYIKQDIKVSRF